VTAGNGPLPVPGTLAAGRLIADRYKLERRIAVGGMGEVWEALDERLGRHVAVKVLRGELSDDDEFLHRFRIEARTVASLNHSGVASIHDYGEDEVTEDGRRTAYLVMELVRGEPLSAVIARGPMEPAETLRIMEQAAHSLYAAHERGFVHRDVKPGNILIRVDGTVKLTDFGIAKAANAVPVTRTGMVMGTAHYIAPEQASGGEAGPEGDVYSLGIVGYECLAGHRPFRAENAVAVAMMQVRDEPPPLPDSVPWRVRQLIETILVKDPNRRYADGAELAAAVAAVRRGEALPTPARLAAQGLRLPSAGPEGGADAGTDPPTSHRRRSKRDRRAARGRDRSRSAPATPSSPSATPSGPSSAPSLPPVSPASPDSSSVSSPVSSPVSSSVSSPVSSSGGPGAPGSGAQRTADRSGPNRTDSVRSGTDRSSTDRNGPNRTDSDRHGTDRNGSSRAMPDTGSDRAAAASRTAGPKRDRPAPERAGSDRAGSDRGASTRGPDRGGADRGTRDRAAADVRSGPGTAVPGTLRSPARGVEPARPTPTPTRSPGTARTATPPGTPTPSPTSGGTPRPTADRPSPRPSAGASLGPATPGAAARTPPPRPPVAPAPPTEPLKLVARQQPNRTGTVLLVAFVLLIVAAVVVAVLTVPKLFADAPAPSTGTVPTAGQPGTGTGSVSGQVAVLARPAAPAGSPGPTAAPTRTEEVR
jgi:serine/threonine protein kinase